LGINRESAISRQGYLEGQVRRLAELREAIDTNSSRMQSLEEEQGIYQELVTAFGRQGVQAMLIETVVPRLEDEANALLGRMTDNRMHLKLETQRERRTGRGEPIETLEINVSDELGPRSYEMYSGGEAFRVNLALRIALSKVLAQRMGAPLPTLFIDEGFGTQDAAGRERILDVISAIQDDFDKIIVITHLDDLKDMFPVRIEVQKDGNGSTFWLS
jgi:exonuclease SbcC